MFPLWQGYTCTRVAVTGESKPEILISGYDNYGNLCGVDNLPVPGVHQSGRDMSNKSYLMVTLVEERDAFLATRSSCVSVCPVDHFTSTSFNRCLPRASYLSNRTVAPIEPRLPLHLLMDAFNLTRESAFDCFVGDVFISWQEIVYSSSIAFIISLLNLVLIKLILRVMIWLNLLGFLLILIFFSCYLWIEWLFFKPTPSTTTTGDSSINATGLANSASVIVDAHSIHTNNRWLLLSITTSLLLILFLISVVRMRKSITMTICLMKQGTRYISSDPFILVQPFIVSTSSATATTITECTFLFLLRHVP